MASDVSRAYINRKSGEIVEISTESELADEADEPADDWPDWRVEEWKVTRRVLDSDDFIPLPGQFEIHEWSIMERFANSLEDETRSGQLLDGLRGRGAFGRFKRLTEQMGLTEQWHEFRANALTEIAIKFLEEHGIPYAA